MRAPPKENGFGRAMASPKIRQTGNMMELQRENMAFRRLRRDRIMFARNPKTGEPRYLAMGDKPKSKDDEDT